MSNEPDAARLQTPPRLEGVASFLSAVVEYSYDAIVTKDLDGIVTSWNPAASAIFGYAANEIIGRSIRLIVPPDRQAEEDRILASIGRGERVEPLETIRQRKDGSVIHVSVTISPIVDERGVIVGASTIARDISERKLVEQQREDLLRTEQAGRRRLDAALRARDVFIAVAAHELRNPLNVLHLTMQMLNRACRDPRDFSRAAGIASNAEAQLSRFAALIDRLLDVTRVRTGALDLYREEFDLSGLVGEIVGRFRREDSAASFELALRPEVRGQWDRLRIDQVITNLISNALKFGSSGPVAIGVAAEGEHAVMRVKDDGVGIPRDELPKIFDLFERGEDPDNKSGLGVGLWITKSIVEAHQGTITAESEPGKGSTFIVRLPLRL